MTTRLSLLTLVWWCVFGQVQADTIFDLDRTEAVFRRLRQGALPLDAVSLQVEDGIVDALVGAGAHDTAGDGASMGSPAQFLAGGRAGGISKGMLVSTAPESEIPIDDHRDYFLATMKGEFIPPPGTLLLFALGGALLCGLVARATQRRTDDY